jgi:hypothetical protein
VTINVLVLSQNARAINAINLADYSQTVFTTNQTISLPYENTMLDLTTTLGHMTTNNVIAGFRVGTISNVEFLLAFTILMVIGIFSVNYVRKYYKR